MKSSVKDLIEYLKTIPNPETVDVEVLVIYNDGWKDYTDVVDFDLKNKDHYEYIEYSTPINGITGTLTLGSD